MVLCISQHSTVTPWLVSVAGGECALVLWYLIPPRSPETQSAGKYCDMIAYPRIGSFLERKFFRVARRRSGVYGRACGGWLVLVLTKLD